MTENPFKKVHVKGAKPADIEALFKDLKNRSPNIRDLFAHQADIIREYTRNHLHSRDVSLELPTGSGKTLVGLLIAEYRRRILGERALYLCPTRQLAHQVVKHSREYGIDARLFVGPKKGYDAQDLTLYRSAETIAISTYSSLFNVNPGLNDPQLIVLDDAHSAETYIASMWSLEIDREREPAVYDDVFEILANDLPSDFALDVVQDRRRQGPGGVEKVPTSSFHRSMGALRQVLDSNIPNPDSDLYFSWTVVRKGLHACHVYISWDQILIRPYIPPTLTHQPFANANQRIYMSATLGSGGELERITGVGKISRIPTPKTYASHGIGRRLFLFPDFAKGPNEYEPWVAEKAALASRTLALCPTKNQAASLRKVINLRSPPPRILGSGDIEESMEPFVKSKRVVLLLTNRYDGIDLPQEDCRQLLIYGLPNRTNLQETFLEERLGLEVLLRELIKTRIAQATGRCTRSDTDYAAVIMAGRSLLDFCARKENQMILHPELRAEIQFALAQKAHELWQLDEMNKAFLEHGEQWATAEQNIAEIRAAEEPPDTTLSAVLANPIQAEVDFAYALWSKDYAKAVECGRVVVDKLSGPRTVAPYAALWCYFVGSVAHEEAKTDGLYRSIAEEFLNRAKDACKTVSWFSHALKSASAEPISKIDATHLQALTVEGIQSSLAHYGAVGPRFQSKIDEVEKLLHSTHSKEFDRGLVELGGLPGYKSWKPEGTAAPDCVWQLGDYAFLLEGKAEETPEGGISVGDCRQASGHINWAKADEHLKNSNCFSILVSPRSSLDPGAVPHTDAIHLFQISGAQKLFERVKQMLVGVRSVMITDKQPELRDLILEKLVGAGLTPETIKAVLLSQPLTSIPTAGKSGVSQQSPSG